jgi:hypothetical protein
MNLNYTNSVRASVKVIQAFEMVNETECSTKYTNETIGGTAV